jgi:nitrogen fixation protein FixH
MREFTGRHAAAVFVGAFGVIIAVNLALAFFAVDTFPGLEVKNSYVASQQFNARKAAQERLGWSVEATEENGRVNVEITDRHGVPVKVAELHAVVGRATQVRDDVEPDLIFNGMSYSAPLELGPGKWDVRITARSLDGTEFVQRVVLHVKG